FAVLLDSLPTRAGRAARGVAIVDELGGDRDDRAGRPQQLGLEHLVQVQGHLTVPLRQAMVTMAGAGHEITPAAPQGDRHTTPPGTRPASSALMRINRRTIRCRNPAMGASPIPPRKYSRVRFTGRLSCAVPARRLRLFKTSGPSVFNW